MCRIRLDKAQLSPLDKNIGTYARFYAYVTEKSPTKMLRIFLTGVRTHLTPLVYGYATEEMDIKKLAEAVRKRPVLYE